MGWEEEEFKGMDLGDPRLNRRTVLLAERLGAFIPLENVARNRTRQTLDWGGQMTKAKLTGALQSVLAKDALLVSNGNPTCHGFAQDAHLAHEAVNLSAGVRVNGAIYVQNVNAYHSRLKQWLHRFHGVATSYLDNYLGWFRALHNRHAASGPAVLAMALGKFPHLTVT